MSRFYLDGVKSSEQGYTRLIREVVQKASDLKGVKSPRIIFQQVEKTYRSAGADDRCLRPTNRSEVTGRADVRSTPVDERRAVASRVTKHAGNSPLPSQRVSLGLSFLYNKVTSNIRRNHYLYRQSWYTLRYKWRLKSWQRQKQALASRRIQTGHCLNFPKSVMVEIARRRWLKRYASTTLRNLGRSLDGSLCGLPESVTAPGATPTLTEQGKLRLVRMDAAGQKSAVRSARVHGCVNNSYRKHNASP